MPHDFVDDEPQTAIVQEVHAAIERILLLEDLAAIALIRDVLSQLSAMVADIAVLGKDPETQERAHQEFRDLMIEISVLSMQLKEAQMSKLEPASAMVDCADPPMLRRGEDSVADNA